jgi:hypothetical protein
MTEPHTKTEILLARIAVALIVGLAVAGVLWYGLCTEVLGRVWRNIAARPGGPMTFRFVLQPMMAGVAALSDGVADARLGRTPYLSAIPFRRGATRRPPVGRNRDDGENPHPRRGHGYNLSARLSGRFLSGVSGDHCDPARLRSLCSAS